MKVLLQAEKHHRKKKKNPNINFVFIQHSWFIQMVLSSFFFQFSLFVFFTILYWFCHTLT